MKQDELSLIKGYMPEKKELLKVIDILNNYSKYKEKGAYIPKGMILYGNPGNGKTLFAKVLASSTDLEFIVFNHNRNNTIQELKNVLETAKKVGKAVVFIDEIDKIVPDEEGYGDNTEKKCLNILLEFIDGYKTEEDNKIFIVATANDYEDLPPSLVRPGRMDKKINLVNPCLSYREQILSYYIDKTSIAFPSVHKIARMTYGFSCSGLRTLVNECVIESIDLDQISDDVLSIIINRINNETIQTTKSYYDLRVRAFEELGRFVVARFYADGTYTIDINNKSSGTIFMSDTVDEIDRLDDDWDEDEINGIGITSKTGLEIIIKIELATIVANEVLNGNLQTNAYRRFNNVKNLLRTYMQCGFAGREYIVEITNAYLQVSEEYLVKYENKFKELLNCFYEEDKRIILKYATVFNKFISPLINCKVLEKEEMKEYIDNLYQ